MRKASYEAIRNTPAVQRALENAIGDLLLEHPNQRNPFDALELRESLSSINTRHLRAAIRTAIPAAFGEDSVRHENHAQTEGHINAAVSVLLERARDMAQGMSNERRTMLREAARERHRLARLEPPGSLRAQPAAPTNAASTKAGRLTATNADQTRTEPISEELASALERRGLGHLVMRPGRARSGPGSQTAGSVHSSSNPPIGGVHLPPQRPRER